MDSLPWAETCRGSVDQRHVHVFGSPSVETWRAKFDGTCSGCKGLIFMGASEVQWAADGVRVIHARPFCRETAPPKTCPTCGLVLPLTGVCDDCA